MEVALLSSPTQLSLRCAPASSAFYLAGVSSASRLAMRPNAKPTKRLLCYGSGPAKTLSRYGLDNNAGLATVGTCLPFGGCKSNSIPNLGTLVIGNVLSDGPVFNALGYLDATFSATVVAAAVPEPSTWAMMIVGLGAAGCALRRCQKATTRVSYAS